MCLTCSTPCYYLYSTSGIEFTTVIACHACAALTPDDPLTADAYGFSSPPRVAPHVYHRSPFGPGYAPCVAPYSALCHVLPALTVQNRNCYRPFAAHPCLNASLCLCHLPYPRCGPAAPPGCGRVCAPPLLRRPACRALQLVRFPGGRPSLGPCPRF